VIVLRNNNIFFLFINDKETGKIPIDDLSLFKNKENSENKIVINSLILFRHYQ